MKNTIRDTQYAILITILILAWLILPQAECIAATYYVDNRLADDCIGTYSITNRDNSGSDGNAYNTPQEAADVVEPGDIVYFREGTYYNHRDLRDAAVVMNILRSGTVDNPITFKNYNNEEVILSGMRPDDDGHFYTVTLGTAPSSSQEISGQGVQNIIIDGLIIEGASRRGLVIYGPANQYASAENPTENVIIRNVIARNNSGGNGLGGGIHSSGKLVNVLIENCQAYNNTGLGIGFGRISKEWHLPEPENDMSAARNSVIRNCLSYNNIHPLYPGNTDGMGGSHMYRCTIENNVVFNNSDDGMDIYASIEVTVKNNIIFGQNYEGGNNAGLKFSAGGGGRHTIAGNVVLNNAGTTFEGSNPSNELRIYYPSRIYNNIAYNGNNGFVFGGNAYTSYPGFEKTYLRNNIGLDNTNHDIYYALVDWTDSDYNFFSNSEDLGNMRGRSQDANSLTGNPQLANKEVVIDTNFNPLWSVEQKLEHIRSQVKEAFSPLEGSILIDAGIRIDGYHNPSPGDSPGDKKVWYGTAPDIGAYEYAPQGAVLYGDVTGDGEITAFDAALAAHIAVDLEHPDIKNRAAADVSGDGEVTAYDAALIAQRAVGLIDRFPVEG